MAARASEVNEGTRKRRGAAARGQQSHVDLDAERAKTERKKQWVRDTTDYILAKKAEREMINAEISNKYKEAKLEGISAKMLKKKIAEFEMDEDKRLAEEASARLINSAFGWDYDQFDWVKAVEQNVSAPKEPPSGNLGDGQAAAIGAHLDKHGSSPLN